MPTTDQQPILDSNGEFSEPPKTIFLQYWGDGDAEEGVKIHHENVSWCWDRIFDQDIQYVRKDSHDALVAALTFYANRENYESRIVVTGCHAENYGSLVESDEGEKARAALKTATL